MRVLDSPITRTIALLLSIPAWLNLLVETADLKRQLTKLALVVGICASVIVVVLHVLVCLYQQPSLDCLLLALTCLIHKCVFIQVAASGERGSQLLFAQSFFLLTLGLNHFESHRLTLWRLRQ